MHPRKYTLSDFDFYLPENLIAQYPAEKRDHSRLFHLNRKTKEYKHYNFYDIIDLLNSNDLLVFNNAKVIPARIFFVKDTGAEVEVVLVRQLKKLEWLIVTNRTKRLKKDSIAYSKINGQVSFRVIDRMGDYLKIKTNCEFTEELLKKIGNIPLPPYIKRNTEDLDSNRYQTVYAKQSGAVAAPTAGLHFTQNIISLLEKKGVSALYLTLNVSWGTFSPVRGENIEEHNMHKESYFLSEENALELNKAKAQGKRIIAVGTTSLRVLETIYKKNKYTAGSGETDIFIYPPYKVRSIDALLTNFHTPKSTLLMLVSAFAGYNFIMGAYREAIKNNYRFFSYGDAMLIE